MRVEERIPEKREKFYTSLAFCPAVQSFCGAPTDILLETDQPQTFPAPQNSMLKIERAKSVSVDDTVVGDLNKSRNLCGFAARVDSVEKQESQGILGEKA